jgi:hypothetical protein
VLGWIGNIFIVIGLWRVGDKHRNAFLFSMVGEAFYVIRSYVLGDWALFSICWVFLLMAGRAYLKWGVNDQ